MEVELYGYRIPFSDNEIAILKLLANINQQKKEFVSDFKKFYWNCNDIINLTDKAETYIYNHMYDICEIIVKDLVDRGVYTLSKDDVFSELYKYIDKVALVTEEVTCQIYKITERYEQERAYREMRKANRGKVIGGGFGLQGAAKGMMTVGTINFATGAVYSIANTLGNLGSSISQTNKLNDLYKNDTLLKYVRAIEEDMNKITVVCEKIYTKQFGISFFYTESKTHDARSIFKQINENMIPEDRMQKAIAHMLFAYPFCEEYFEIAYDKLGDADGNLSLYAKLVGLNIDYSEREAKKQYYQRRRVERDSVWGCGEKAEEKSIRYRDIYDTHLKNECLTEMIANANLLEHSVDCCIAYICSYYCENEKIYDNKILVTFEVRQKKYDEYYRMIQAHIGSNEKPLLMIFDPQKKEYDLITTRRVISGTGVIAIIEIDSVKSYYSFPIKLICGTTYFKLIQAIIIYLQCLMTRNSKEKIPAFGGEVGEVLELPVDNSIDSELLVAADSVGAYVYETYQVEQEYHLIMTKWYMEEKLDEKQRLLVQKLWNEVITNRCAKIPTNEEIILIALCGAEHAGLIFTEKNLYIFSRDIQWKIYAYSDITYFECGISKVTINDTIIKNKLFDGPISWYKWMNSNIWKLVKHFMAFEINE